MIFLSSQETKEVWPLIRTLGNKAAKKALPIPVMTKRIKSPMTICASALSDDRKTAIAYVSLSVVTERYYQKLLGGKATEGEFEPWDEKDTPLLFLRNKIITDPTATPYVFRSAYKELHQLIENYELYLHRVFTLASHWASQRMLKAYGFTEVGRDEEKRAIMMASRDKSAVVNSYLKVYPKN